MGWKAVKEHYQIKHIVHMRDGHLCIGSPYISNIIEVSTKGKILKRYEWGSSDELANYQRAIEETPEVFTELMAKPDAFDKHITVYTYDEGAILEKQCEELGWPNITHDGQLMYENTFSDNRAKIVETAIRNAQAHESMTNRALKEAQDQVIRLKKELEKVSADVEKLLQMRGQPQ